MTTFDYAVDAVVVEMGPLSSMNARVVRLVQAC